MKFSAAEFTSAKLSKMCFKTIALLCLISTSVFGQANVFGGIQPGNPGVLGTIGAQGNVFNRNGHSIDAHGQVSKNFRPIGPTAIGGGINYQGPRAGVSGNVDHVHRFGTNVGVSGNANLWRSNNGRTSVDADAGYNRHFGGQFGTGRPNYNGNINFRHRF